MKVLRNVAALGVLAALAGGVLAWFAGATEGLVKENRRAAASRVVRELAGVEVEVAGQDDVFFCERGLAVLGGVGRGYGGAFRLAVAVGGGGRVKGVRVLEHRETPGFGDILAPAAAWLASFRRGEAHAVTGATITSTAVIAAVRRVAARARQEGCVR